MKLIKFSPLILIVLASFVSKAQVKGYPHVKAETINEKPLWYSINVPITLPGAIGVTAQVEHIKPNSFYANGNIGVGYVLNLSQAFVEEKNRNFKPMGTLEVGYALKIGTRSNSRRLLTGGLTTTGDGNTAYNYYEVSVPHHVLFVPVIGISHDPIVAKVTNINDRTLGDKGRYSVALTSLNLGVKLLGVNRTEVAVKDSKTGKVFKGSTQQLGGIYAGLSLPLVSEVEVPNGFTNIMKSQSPSFEIYGILPSYLNSAGTFGFGIKSVPYTRDATLVPGSNERNSTSPGYQLFINYRIYL